MTDPAPELKTPIEARHHFFAEGAIVDAEGNCFDTEELIAAYNALSADLAKLRAERDDLKKLVEDLAAWSRKWPRNRPIPAGNCDEHYRELNALEDRAKALVGGKGEGA